MIGSKWAFHVKRNGTHRSRLVALGYAQIYEEDFTDNELSFVREIVERYNGVRITNDMAEKYVGKAKSSISSLPDSDYKHSLNSLAEYIVERRT